MKKQSHKKEREGVVISNKMDKTVIVQVSKRERHPQYQKVIIRSKKYYAHSNEKLTVGTKVLIEETRPISKLKRWKVRNVLEKPEVENAQ